MTVVYVDVKFLQDYSLESKISGWKPDAWNMRLQGASLKRKIWNFRVDTKNQKSETEG